MTWHIHIAVLFLLSSYYLLLSSNQSQSVCLFLFHIPTKFIIDKLRLRFSHKKYIKIWHSNWEILTKNLVILQKDKTVLRLKNFNILGVHWKNFKIFFFGGGVTKNQYRGGDCLKKGRGFGQFADLRGSLARKRGCVFEGGVDTPMHTNFWV